MIKYCYIIGTPDYPLEKNIDYLPHNIHKNKSQIDQRFKGENKTWKNKEDMRSIYFFIFKWERPLK